MDNGQCIKYGCGLLGGLEVGGWRLELEVRGWSGMAAVIGAS
jgi:hypothetical protein